jgi:hypothetical protein
MRETASIVSRWRLKGWLLMVLDLFLPQVGTAIAQNYIGGGLSANTVTAIQTLGCMLVVLFQAVVRIFPELINGRIPPGKALLHRAVDTLVRRWKLLGTLLFSCATGTALYSLSIGHMPLSTYVAAQNSGVLLVTGSYAFVWQHTKKGWKLWQRSISMAFSLAAMLICYAYTGTRADTISLEFLFAVGAGAALGVRIIAAAKLNSVMLVGVAAGLGGAPLFLKSDWTGMSFVIGGILVGIGCVTAGLPPALETLAQKKGGLSSDEVGLALSLTPVAASTVGLLMLYQPFTGRQLTCGGALFALTLLKSIIEQRFFSRKR